MIEDEQQREAAYGALRHWQSVAADPKRKDVERESARSEALRCARLIAGYERQQFWIRAEEGANGSSASSILVAPGSASNS